jgi:hypothetical protein
MLFLLNFRIFSFFKKNKDNIPPEFQVALKPKVERCTESGKVAFRAHIRVTFHIETYREFKMRSNNTIL